MKIQLDMKQNALHSIQHAIELINKATCQIGSGNRKFDSDSFAVEWRDEANRLCFVMPLFSPLPPEYSLKFAIIHLIQAAELTLKEYIFSLNPEKIFTQKGKTKKTISLVDALNFIRNSKSNFITQAEYEFIKNTKYFRNDIEHYKFECTFEFLRNKCADFLALCAFLCETLLSINFAEAFDFDYLKDEPNPALDFLSDIFHNVSDLGRNFIYKTGFSWVQRNPLEKTYLCLFCHEEFVPLDKDICVGCLSTGDEKGSQLIKDLEKTTEMYLMLQKILYSKFNN